LFVARKPLPEKALKTTVDATISTSPKSAENLNRNNPIASVSQRDIDKSTEPPHKTANDRHGASNSLEKCQSILKFLCKNEKSWSINGFAVYEATANGKGETIENQADELERKRLEVAMDSHDTTSQKLLRMASITSLNVEMYCKYEDQTLLKDVVAKFGPPDSVEEAIIDISRTSASTKGQWCHYGPIHLGVFEDGRILKVRIVGPAWQEAVRTAQKQPERPAEDGRQKSDDIEFLKPPGFVPPKGKHINTNAKLLPDDLYQRLWFVVVNTKNVKGDLLKHNQLASLEYKRMVQLLSNDKIVGDGTYCDVGYGNINPADGTVGQGWGMAIHGTPAPRNSELIMRVYVNGNGIPERELEQVFGMPRLKKQIGETHHLLYGNVDVIYATNGDFRGCAFFFKP
jgi:hypothetical protein